MIIKSFTSESVSAALKRVRTELGGDAVVLKTRQIADKDGRNRVEITACLDNPTTAQAESALAPRTVTAIADHPVVDENRDTDGGTVMQAPVHLTLTQIDRKLDQLLGRGAEEGSPADAFGDELSRLRRQLRAADVPEEIVEDIVTKVQAIDDAEADAVDVACQYIQTELDILASSTVDFQPGDRIAIIGPAGAGKTSVLGKLAARLGATGSHEVVLSTLDLSKVGSLDEIQCYADLLGVHVTDPGQFDNEDNSEHVLLIDTEALPGTTDKLDSLASKLKSQQPTYCLLTFSCLTSSADIRATAERVRRLAPTHLVVTMLDLSARWGSVLTASRATGLPLLFVADSASGTGRLKTPDAAALTDGILGKEGRYESA